MNEELIVYAFLDENGEEQEFITLDKVVACSYAGENDYDIIERIYTYSRTLSASESDINRTLDL